MLGRFKSKKKEEKRKRKVLSWWFSVVPFVCHLKFHASCIFKTIENTATPPTTIMPDDPASQVSQSVSQPPSSSSITALGIIDFTADLSVCVVVCCAWVRCGCGCGCVVARCWNGRCVPLRRRRSCRLGPAWPVARLRIQVVTTASYYWLF